jgi:hypothetical protein
VAALIVFPFHSHFFSSRAYSSNSSLFVLATSKQKDLSVQSLGHNDLFSNATSKVDIDDISFTLNFFFNSPSRVDLFINFLVSVFTSYKNFKSFESNLGRMCVKQISSHFTTKSHNTSLSPLIVERLFCALFLLLALEEVKRHHHHLCLLFFLIRVVVKVAFVRVSLKTFSSKNNFTEEQKIAFSSAR